MTKQPRLSWSALPLCFLLAVPSSALGQRTTQKTTPAPKAAETTLTEEQLPAFAVSLVISLATEARSYSDVALRPRVLARAADVLWSGSDGEIVEHATRGGLYRYRAITARHGASTIAGTDRRSSERSESY